MNLRLFLSILFIYTGTYSYTQQLKLDKGPEDYQLFARDKNDSATVLFSGRVTDDAKFNELRLKVYKDGILYDNKSVKIENRGFKFSSIIQAGLFQYRFELYHQIESVEKLSFIADNVVCGDAYIITGQSNSHASSNKSSYTSPFCRSFGVKTGYEKYTDEDKKIRWGLATGNCLTCKGDGWEKGFDGGWFVKNPYGVGVWGMELAQLLVEKYKIPVCIINGGSGSSTIEQNMLYPEKISLETSFGRLAYRVDQAGLKDGIKAIFYHQGESDSVYNRYLSYSDSFDILNKDWKRVYTGLDKVYLFQIHPGCGGSFQSELREIQNQISKRYDHVEIMSTTGVVGHDGCHFSYEGYQEFAKRILPLVSRDLLGEQQRSIITPPQLLNAYYSGKREITLDFDQLVEIENFLEVNGVKHFMKDQFFFNVEKNSSLLNGVVNSIVSKKEQVIIKLNSDKKYFTVTWLPNKEYPKTNDIYNGPWIRGSDNKIGALSFYKRNINN
jgi:hypothetical protein|tara:strand:- start:2420 stop:3913 length:1494 start_codon:yes stop_codon:yes gene_type:complete